MTAISSHRDLRGIKMRILIVTVFLACAAAKPSGLFAPVAVPLVGIRSAIPTISSGDVQAAAIDAQVRARDWAIAVNDKNREIAEFNVKNLNTVAFAPVAAPLVGVRSAISSGDAQAAAIDAQVRARDWAIAVNDKNREIAELNAKNLNTVAVAPVAAPLVGVRSAISSGDVQAAAIDAQVRARDWAIAVNDKNREIAEFNAKNLNTVAVAPVAAPLVAIRSAIPTVSSGDVQAASIDAQVRARDWAIAVNDKNREIAELNVKNLNTVAVAPVAAPLVAIRSAIPTVTSGDVQAAAIDAQVRTQDWAIAVNDKNREIAELNVKNLNEQIITRNDEIKEQSEEAFWSAQDKQWQAIDSLRTAEAQIDGAIASNANAWANNAVAAPYLIAGGPVVAGVAPVSGAVITNPGIIAPAFKTTTIENKNAEPAMAEAPVHEEKKSEALVRTSEERREENDSVAIEAAAPETGMVKNIENKPQLPLVAPLSIAQPYAYSSYAVAPGLTQLTPGWSQLAPGLALSPYGALQSINTIDVAPTLLKTAC